MKKRIALLALCVAVLAGCEKPTTAEVQPDTTTEPPADIQVDKTPKQEQDIPQKEEPVQITQEQASAYVTESIDASQYTATLSDEQLTVGTDQPQEYFVFEVTDAQGGTVGKIAINRETGEKYNYLGDGVIEDYKTFALYDAAVDAVCDWQGKYSGVASTTLEILQGDASSFEFVFSDGTTGNAHVTGTTAKSVDGKISFLFSDNIITVAGGTVTGNYTAAVAQ